MSADLSRLKARVSALAEQQPFAVHWQIRLPRRWNAEQDDDGVIGSGAQAQVASFSTRKVSLLAATLALVHRGDLSLDQRLAVTEAMKDGVQAGIMKNVAPGVELSLEDHLRQMMITSDNICTQLVFAAIDQVTGDCLQWVNDYCAWVGMRATVHREIFPRSGDLDWHHSIESMTVTTPADQAHLLALLGQGTHDDAAAERLHLSPRLCRFAVELMYGIYTPLFGAGLLGASLPNAGSISLRFAEKNGRGLRSLSQIGLATAGDTPVAAVAVYAENIPTQLPDGTPGRLAAYTFFAQVGRAVQDWHLGEDGAPGARAEDPPPAAQHSGERAEALRQSAHTAGCVIDDGGIRQLGTPQPQPQPQPHPLAGVGKLFAAVALAERAQTESALAQHPQTGPGLLELPVRIRQQHRDQAAVGPLRTHTADLTLALGDALGLIISTSDAAAALAVQEALQARGLDLVADAQALTRRLGRGAHPLTDTVITGGEPDEVALGDLLVGETTADDVVHLLAQLASAGGLTVTQPRGEESARISAEAAELVLRWMAQVFEPSGLTYALPGYGPKKVPQWSVAGTQLRSPSSQGWSSVMIARAPVRAGESDGVVCAAAHIGSSDEGGREVAEAFGALGLAAYRSTG